MTVYKPHTVYAGMGKAMGDGTGITWHTRPDDCSRVNWEAMKREFARQQVLDFYDLAAMRPLTPGERDAMKRYVDFLPDDALVQAQGERALGAPQPKPVKPMTALPPELRRSYTKRRVCFTVGCGAIAFGALAVLAGNTGSAFEVGFMLLFGIAWCTLLTCVFTAGAKKDDRVREPVESIMADLDRLDAMIQQVEQEGTEAHRAQ